MDLPKRMLWTWGGMLWTYYIVNTITLKINKHRRIAMLNVAERLFFKR
jgi:hypothetical protein